MKKNKIRLLLSILVVSCIIIIPAKQVFATGVEGGQVSVPGKITFETETKTETTKEKEKDKPKETIEKKEEQIKPDGKKFYSVLPKTGESDSKNTYLGFGILLMTVFVFMRRKWVLRNEE